MFDAMTGTQRRKIPPSLPRRPPFSKWVSSIYDLTPFAKGGRHAQQGGGILTASINYSRTIRKPYLGKTLTSGLAA